MKFTFIIFILFASALSLLSQNSTISGTVIDSESALPLEGAQILLLETSDSSTYKLALADEKGNFSMNNVKPGSYYFRISYLGYKQLYNKIVVTSSPFSAGNFQLQAIGKQLKGVEIVEKSPVAVQKGDTTQYNASSYKTNPDASAEDLLNKMGGISTQEGKLKAHGEDVQKVLVDGKPFFGDDPSAVIKNLPADVIDKIQVFDQQSDQAKFTGISDGNTSKTINIITKPGMKNGVFGRVFAGYGYDNVYKSGFNVNIFKGERRLSFLMQSNNTNEQNFTSDDLAGVMTTGGGTRRGGDWNNSNNSTNFLVNAKNGISTTHAFGINYSDRWNKKTEFSSSYFFNTSQNTAEQLINRQYLQASDSGQTYKESSIISSLNTNHRINMKVEFKADSSNVISFKPKFTLQQNEGTSLVEARTSSSDAILASSGTLFNSDLLSCFASAELEFQHKFLKKGRTFSINLNGNYSTTNANSILTASGRYYSDTVFTGTQTDQQSLLLRKGEGLISTLNYTEPLNLRNSLQFQYVNTVTRNDSDKRTYNFEPSSSEYSQQVNSLSSVFESRNISHRTGLTYRFNKETFNFQVGVNYQNSVLENNQLYPATFKIKRNFEDLLPNAMLRYNFSAKKSLRIFYRTQTTQPSIEQLQEVINNTNPLLLSTGNAELRQNYEHRLFSRYSSSNTEKGSSFFALISVGVIQHYIGNNTFIAMNDTIYKGVQLSRGAQLSHPVNMNGYQSLRTFVTYGFPFSLIKSNLNINFNTLYSRTPGLINEKLNYVSNNNFGAGLSISSNFSTSIDFSISTNSSYTIVENTSNSDLNSNFINQTSKAKINLMKAQKFVFTSELIHQYYGGLSAGFNQNFLLWNAAVAYKFLKGRKAEIRFSVNDILGQNQSISRNVTENYIEDVQTTVLQRYYMLTFSYTIREFPKKAE